MEGEVIRSVGEEREDLGKPGALRPPIATLETWSSACDMDSQSIRDCFYSSALGCCVA